MFAVAASAPTRETEPLTEIRWSEFGSKSVAARRMELRLLRMREIPREVTVHVIRSVPVRFDSHTDRVACAR